MYGYLTDYDECVWHSNVIMHVYSVLDTANDHPRNTCKVQLSFYKRYYHNHEPAEHILLLLMLISGHYKLCGVTEITLTYISGHYKLCDVTEITLTYISGHYKLCGVTEITLTYISGHYKLCDVTEITLTYISKWPLQVVRCYNT